MSESNLGKSENPAFFMDRRGNLTHTHIYIYTDEMFHCQVSLLYYYRVLHWADKNQPEPLAICSYLADYSTYDRCF